MELGEALNWQPQLGELLLGVDDEQGGHALIRLDASVAVGNRDYRYVVASPRQRGTLVSVLHSGNPLDCALIGISEEQAMSDRALDTSNWRGGLAFLGTVTPE